MSYNYPNAISDDAYLTLINSGLNTSIGRIRFNPVTLYTMTGPNFYGSNVYATAIANAYSLYGDNQILFKFEKTIENYSNRNLGETTINITGVGVTSHDNNIYLCPIGENDVFLTQYEGQPLDITPNYCDLVKIATFDICAVMTNQPQNGGYVPTLSIGAPVDVLDHADAYLKAHNTYSLGYFLNVGMDIFEYGLFGKYWNDKDGAPENDEGGGGGGYDAQGEQLTMPNLPSDGILSTHLVTAYNCTPSELQSFSQYLWSANFFDNILKNFSSPLENIVSCHILPFSSSLIASLPSTIKVGNVDSGVMSNRINDNNQYVTLDFGRININESYKTFGDFDTRITLFLPFSGYTEIDVSDCMNGWLWIFYRVDIITGDFIACVCAQSPFSKYSDISINWNVEYNIIEQKTGNMAEQLPLSGANYTSLFTGALSMVGQFSSGNILGGVSSLATIKPQYGKTGNMGGNVGRLGYTKPYVILHRHNYREPNTLRTKSGYMSNISKKLNEIGDGFIKVKQGTFDGANLTCTKNELDEIISLMESGVYTR